MSFVGATPPTQFEPVAHAVVAAVQLQSIVADLVIVGKLKNKIARNKKPKCKKVSCFF